MIELDPRLGSLLAEQPYPFVFITVSGAHLYGFPSPNSDWDLRGVHVLPPAEVMGLRTGRETIEYSGDREGVDADLVTHDALKFFRLLLRPNGYVLEQLLSPFIVATTPEHEELKSLVPKVLTRYHAHHYLGFATTQWRLFEKESPRKVKPLLYVYRVLLTGIHLMNSGELEANLLNLNTIFKLPQIQPLVDRKLAGPELQTLDAEGFTFHEQEYRRLVEQLEGARDMTRLPETPTAEPELNALLLRLRKCPDR